MDSKSFSIQPLRNIESSTARQSMSLKLNAYIAEKLQNSKKISVEIIETGLDLRLTIDDEIFFLKGSDENNELRREIYFTDVSNSIFLYDSHTHLRCVSVSGATELHRRPPPVQARHHTVTLERISTDEISADSNIIPTTNNISSPIRQRNKRVKVANIEANQRLSSLEVLQNWLVLQSVPMTIERKDIIGIFTGINKVGVFVPISVGTANEMDVYLEFESIVASNAAFMRKGERFSQHGILAKLRSLSASEASCARAITLRWSTGNTITQVRAASSVLSAFYPTSSSRGLLRHPENLSERLQSSGLILPNLEDIASDSLAGRSSTALRRSVAPLMSGVQLGMEDGFSFSLRSTGDLAPNRSLPASEPLNAIKADLLAMAVEAAATKTLCASLIVSQYGGGNKFSSSSFPEYDIDFYRKVEMFKIEMFEHADHLSRFAELLYSSLS